MNAHIRRRLLQVHYIALSLGIFLGTIYPFTANLLFMQYAGLALIISFVVAGACFIPAGLVKSVGGSGPYLYFIPACFFMWLVKVTTTIVPSEWLALIDASMIFVALSPFMNMIWSHFHKSEGI